MIKVVYGCFITCNVSLAGNCETVSLELQCFTAKLITFIVCECDAPECLCLEIFPYAHLFAALPILDPLDVSNKVQHGFLSALMHQYICRLDCKCDIV